jgi:general stress protein YciG
MTPAERGRLGGQATAKKYGREYMREIGQRGFTATQARMMGNPYLVNKLIAKLGKWPQKPPHRG